MIRFQDGGRDRAGPSKELLGVDRLFRDLTHDAEVVQGVGEIRMERAEAGLLQKGSLAQKLFSRCVITGSSRLFRRIDDGSRFACFRHGFPCAETLGAPMVRRTSHIVEQQQHRWRGPQRIADVVRNRGLGPPGSRDGSAVRSEQVNARGRHVKLDDIADLGQVLGRDRRQEAVRPDLTVDMAGAAEAFDQEYSTRHRSASRVSGQAFP